MAALLPFPPKSPRESEEEFNARREEHYKMINDYYKWGGILIGISGGALVILAGICFYCYLYGPIA